MAATKAKGKKPAKRRRSSKRRKKPVDLPVEAWERQRGESAPAFQAFATYRDQGPERSLNKVARSLSKSRSLIGEWSMRWSWQMRTEAWDRDVDRQTQAELRQDRIDAARRHAELARGFQALLGQGVQTALERLEKDPELLKRLSPKDLLVFASQGGRGAARLAEAERLALDMSTSNLGGPDGGPLLSPEERARKMTDPELDDFLLGATAGYAAGAESAKGQKD